jgi:hypothetical protein
MTCRSSAPASRETRRTAEPSGTARRHWPRRTGHRTGSGTGAARRAQESRRGRRGPP